MWDLTMHSLQGCGNVRLITIHNGLKRTISTSSGLGLLQMESEPGTRQCASESTLDPQGGWIVRSHVSWRGDQSIPCKGVETTP